MTLRIVGGLLRGRYLKTPKSSNTRPTTSMLREAVFNICRSWVNGARFLDLYAGSGAMGFEAISRGASFATFVEKDRIAAQIIRENAEDFQLQMQSQVLCLDVKKALCSLTAPYDLIYIDPPYDKETEQTLQLIVEKKLLAPHGLIFVEERFERKEVPKISGLDLVESRRYGISHLLEYRWSI